MPAKKKRKYTFGKNQPIAYESGSLIHREVKLQRAIAKEVQGAFGTGARKKKTA